MSTPASTRSTRPEDALAALLRLSGASSPFEPTSRYHRTALTVAVDRDGRSVACLARRVLPQPGSIATAGIHRVVEGDRADLVAHRLLGDAGLWWRLCDVNGVMAAAELTSAPGRMIRIGRPEGMA